MVDQRGRGGVKSATAALELALAFMGLRKDRLFAGQFEETQNLMFFESENRAIGVLAIVIQRYMHI